MTRTIRSAWWVILCALLLSIEPSPAIFGIFRKDKDRLPTKGEVARHDREAARLFATGEKAQNEGKSAKALKAYSAIVRKWHFSNYTGEATFRVAELLHAQGELLDAFDHYQALVQQHRSSPRFQRAVEQQYNIAVKALTGKHSNLFGVVPRKTSRDRVIEMFTAVIQNAPASIYAANSQYYIGRTHEGREHWDKAIAAFQKVVDDYPRSPKAPQAQLKIGEIYEKTAKRPDNPTNLRETREAYEDFITKYPQHRDSGDAYAQLNAISEREAKKSLKLAKYYQKRGNMKAAAIYFKDVLRSSNAALKLEARQGIAAVGKVDPEALERAKIDESATRVDPADRLKNQRQYLGPPAPDVVTSRSKPASTPTTEADRVASELPRLPASPPPSISEPDLPGTPELNVEPLAPAPPPVSEDDILGGGSPVVGEDTDLESLLPPPPTTPDSGL